MLTLIDARETFDTRRRKPEFGWVGDVAQPLRTLQDCLNETDALCAIAGPIDVRALLAKSDAPAALVSSLAQASSDLSRTLEVWDRAADALWDVAEFDVDDIGEGLNWKKTSSAFTALSKDSGGAGLAADLLKYRATLALHQLSAFADAATSREVPPEQLDDIYELVAISSLLRSYLGGEGQELGRLGSLSLDAARQSFKRVDKELHKLEAAAIVATRLKDRGPRGISHGPRATHTELGLLEHEVELKRPRTPLRDVAHRAGEALQALKPVWMMSPTSIAQFIRPGSLKFDLLIVDEASQMRPEFSVSCIMRADQFVVVGDANQLPPSDHFQVASG